MLENNVPVNVSIANARVSLATRSMDHSKHPPESMVP